MGYKDENQNVCFNLLSSIKCHTNRRYFFKFHIKIESTHKISTTYFLDKLNKIL